MALQAEQAQRVLTLQSLVLQVQTVQQVLRAQVVQLLQFPALQVQTAQQVLQAQVVHKGKQVQ